MKSNTVWNTLAAVSFTVCLVSIVALRIDNGYPPDVSPDPVESEEDYPDPAPYEDPCAAKLKQSEAFLKDQERVQKHYESLKNE